MSADRQNSATDDKLDIFAVAAVPLKYPRTLVSLPLIFAVVALGLGLLSGPTYESTASFLPESGSGEAQRYGALAAQMGFSLPTVISSGSESASFYAALIQSPAILRRVVVAEYIPPEDMEGMGPGTLMQWYDIQEETSEERIRSAVAKLADQVRVRPDLESGLVYVTVAAASEWLAVAVNEKLVTEMMDFNVSHRTNRASAERAFLQARVEAAREDLLAAEQEVEAFLEGNRSYRDSPQLTFEFSRLQRQLDLRQQLYVSLVQAYQQSRVEEVRTMPAVTIVDPPGTFVDVRHNARLLMLFGFVAGMFVAIVYAFAREWLKQQLRAAPEAVEEFVSVGRSFWDRLLRSKTHRQ